MKTLIVLLTALVEGFESLGERVGRMLRDLMRPRHTVHAMAGDPNVIGAFITVVPCDAAMETTPTIAELCLLGCPDELGVQLAVEYIGFRCNTLPVDSGVNIKADIEFIDDSDSDAVSNLKAAYDLKGSTVLIMNTVFQGWQVLDPGDVINAEFDVATPTTASEGAAFVVMGKVLSKSSS